MYVFLYLQNGKSLLQVSLEWIYVEICIYKKHTYIQSVGSCFKL